MIFLFELLQCVYIKLKIWLQIYSSYLGDKKLITKMTEVEMKEILDDIPNMTIHNPIQGFKSSYAQVMKDFVNLISQWADGKKPDSILAREIAKSHDITEFLKLQLASMKVFYGGFLPPLIKNDSSPLGIDVDIFLKYWECLSGDPAYTFFVELHGCLDYIWYEGDNLHPVRTLDLPNFYQDLPFKIAPTEVIPSDHFPIVTEFVLI